MSGVIWKSTTVVRDGDDVMTEVAEGRCPPGRRVAFVRRRRVMKSMHGSTGQAVTINVNARGNPDDMIVDVTNSVD